MKINEEQIRYHIETDKNIRGYEQLSLAVALLHLDELKAIRKLLEPEIRIEVAPPDEAPAEPAHPLRDEWDSMLPHQRLHFGSFDAYCRMQAELDAPDDKPLVVKWMAGEHLTTEQIRDNMGVHEGKYAINVDNLTDRQKALP